MSPLYTVLLSFAINLFGAAAAVYMLPNPIVAVAISTVVAQWAGACFILQRVSQQEVTTACKRQALCCGGVPAALRCLAPSAPSRRARVIDGGHAGALPLLAARVAHLALLCDVL